MRPPPNLSEADQKGFQSSHNIISHWAERRVRYILNALYDRLRQLYGERFRGLYVFGSYARHDAGVELPIDSDLDVALLLSEVESAGKEIQRYGQITADLSLQHGLVVSVIPVHELDFREGRTNFTRVISEYAIKVG